MMYLLWAIINLLLLLYFLSISINAIKLIRKNCGSFPCAVFIFGILSFTGCLCSDKPIAEKNKEWNFISKEDLVQNSNKLITLQLEDNLISKYNLQIVYAKNKQLNMPVTAYSTTDGFIICTEWSPSFITIEKTLENNKFHYNVIGTVEWKILNTRIYTQLKSYSGAISLNS